MKAAGLIDLIEQNGVNIDEDIEKLICHHNSYKQNTVAVLHQSSSVVNFQKENKQNPEYRTGDIRP